MTHSAHADVPTAHAAKYLQQLCKHWQHSLTVELAADHGTVQFPRDARGSNWPGDGKASFIAHPNLLTVRIDASDEAHLDALKQVVARHLDRFAFREAPLEFNWQ